MPSPNLNIVVMASFGKGFATFVNQTNKLQISSKETKYICSTEFLQFLLLTLNVKFSVLYVCYRGEVIDSYCLKRYVPIENNKFIVVGTRSVGNNLFTGCACQKLLLYK